MVEYKTIMREYNRMCSSMWCDYCPVASGNQGTGISCLSFMKRFPEEAGQEWMVMKMSNEHCIMVCGLVMFLFGYIFGWIRRGG